MECPGKPQASKEHLPGPCAREASQDSALERERGSGASGSALAPSLHSLKKLGRQHGFIPSLFLGNDLLQVMLAMICRAEASPQPRTGRARCPPTSACHHRKQKDPVLVQSSF